MNNVKRIRDISLALIIVITISISGCSPTYSKDKVAMVTQIFYAVPGAREIHPHEIGCEFIDTDNSGRKLFAFHSGEVMGFCILQKYDNKYVYYYDNLSYLISMKEYKKCTPEELDALKEANDWDEAMDHEKMIKREFVESTLEPNRKLDYHRDIAQRAFYSTIGEDEKISTYICFFDFSHAGQEIFFISRDERKTTNTGYEWVNIDYYLMILNSDGTYDPENYLAKFEDLSQSNVALAEIKERNGWNA